MSSYHNFDLELFDYKEADGEARFRVCVVGTPGGGRQRLDQSEEVRLGPALRQGLGLLARSRPQGDELRRLGRELGGLLLPPEARQFLLRAWNGLRAEEALRIRLKLSSPVLADIPWEICALDADGAGGLHGFLLLDRRIALVRDEILAEDRRPMEPVSRLRLVALLASPEGQGYDQLDLAAERGLLEQVAGGIERLRLDLYAGGTLHDLENALLRPAQIFHFAGHGQFTDEAGGPYRGGPGEGAIVLLDEGGRAWPYSARKLGQQLAARGVRLAVLNACETARQDQVGGGTGVATALLRADIPAVVGMQYRIQDASAQHFTARLYAALAAGGPIEEALWTARRAVADRLGEGDRDWAAPALYLRSYAEALFPVSPGGDDGGRPAQISRVQLRDMIAEHFSLADVETLCFDLQEILRSKGRTITVSLEEMGGGGKKVQIQRLIEFAQRRGFLDLLIEEVRRARPGLL